MNDKDNKPPERIYLQCYDEYDGSLLDLTRDDVTWCVDKINDNDAVYVLVTERPAMEGKFAYVGRKPCGCAVGVVTDLRDKRTANAVAGLIADGLIVNRVSWIAYYQIAAEETFMACPHGPQGQLALSLDDDAKEP